MNRKKGRDKVRDTNAKGYRWRGGGVTRRGAKRKKVEQKATFKEDKHGIKTNQKKWMKIEKGR